MQSERDLFDNEPAEPPGWWTTPTISSIRSARKLTIAGLALAGAWILLCVLGGDAGAMIGGFGSGLAAAIYSPLAGAGALVGQRPAKRIWMAIFAFISIAHAYWILLVARVGAMIPPPVRGIDEIPSICIATGVAYGLAYLPFAGWKIVLAVMAPLTAFAAAVSTGGESLLGVAMGALHIANATTLGLASHRTLTRARRAIDSRHCASCGYNLEGNTTGLCPECGRVLTLRSALRRLQA